jgi:hypothetical protein
MPVETRGANPVVVGPLEDHRPTQPARTRASKRRREPLSPTRAAKKSAAPRRSIEEAPDEDIYVADQEESNEEDAEESDLDEEYESAPKPKRYIHSVEYRANCAVQKGNDLAALKTMRSKPSSESSVDAQMG